MVDLSKAKAGDTVKFRCGGEAPIEYITRHSENMVAIQYHGQVCLTYRNDGRRSPTTGEEFNCKTPPETPFDITAIIPAQFDWSTVKPGMAFIDKEIFNGSPIVYVADHISDKDYAVLVFGKSDQSTLLYDAFVSKKTELTRAPEHDVEVG